MVTVANPKTEVHGRGNNAEGAPRGNLSSPVNSGKGEVLRVQRDGFALWQPQEKPAERLEVLKDGGELRITRKRGNDADVIGESGEGRGYAKGGDQTPQEGVNGKDKEVPGPNTTLFGAPEGPADPTGPTEKSQKMSISK